MTPRIDRFLRRLHLARVAEQAAGRASAIAETEAALADTVDALPARWTCDGLVVNVPALLPVFTRDDAPRPVLLTAEEWAAYALPEAAK